VSDKYDAQATKIIEQYCRMIEVSTGVHEELRVAIAKALRDADAEGYNKGSTDGYNEARYEQ